MAKLKHLYAAIEHRVIDSPAYADLSHSARSVLTVLARQLTKDNNGHLQATASFMERYGISEKSVQRAIASLIEHGFVYRTCADRLKPHSNDWKRVPAKYAVTWLSITKKDGLYLAGFAPCAWRNWTGKIGKNPTVRMAVAYGQIDRQPPPAKVNLTVLPPVKNTDNELVPIPTAIPGRTAERNERRTTRPYSLAIKQKHTLDRGVMRITH